MRILPPARPRLRDAAFIADQRLRGMVVRMITLNSLGAFAQEIGRRPLPEAVSPVTAPAGRSSAATPGTTDSGPQQRTLEAAPGGPAPIRPLPRGSLLDLRV